MDKKRRRTESLEKEVAHRSPLAYMLKPTAKYEHCGILSEKFNFLEDFGTGYYEYHSFDGLYISICDVTFTKDHIVKIDLLSNILELSFLIEGEQIITIDHTDDDLVYESQESYMMYLAKVSGTITYHQRKRFKKVKIQMDQTFIKKHKLDEEYLVFNQDTVDRSQQHFTKPQDTKTQEILSELLLDTRKGLLKRLFLESRTLALIGLQLEDTNALSANTTTDQLIKKLYTIQGIISSDISIQHSIQELSRQVGLNDFLVKKEFKHVFGTTIFEYTMQLRIATAQRLLIHSQKPIYEISEAVGYKNATHFTAAFKKAEGMTPKQYRKMM